MTDDADPESRRLSPRAADRLLARAAELDAAGGATVAELRAAAAEAGIPARGFDAAVAELGGPGRHGAGARQGPRPRRRLAAAGVAMLLAAGALALTRGRPPGGGTPPAAAPTAEEAFALRCLAPGDAAELVRPLLADRSARVTVAPAHAPHVLTVRAAPARLEQARALLARHDAAGAPACRAAPPSAPAGSTR